MGFCLCEEYARFCFGSILKLYGKLIKVSSTILYFSVIKCRIYPIIPALFPHPIIPKIIRHNVRMPIFMPGYLSCWSNAYGMILIIQAPAYIIRLKFSPIMLLSASIAQKFTCYNYMLNIIIILILF